MLYGRADEQAAVERLVTRARTGTSGVLVVRGEPGIGKSALLEQAIGAAEGMRVLRGTGIESEAELPFAGLHLLLRPALGLLDRLPSPQQAALRGAFGLGLAYGERLLVGLSVLSLLSEYAGTDGLLCVIDDAQWLDHASAEALMIAARRLDGEGVALLLAARTPGLPAPGLPQLQLEPLDERASASLLAEADADVPLGLSRRVLAEAAGNPLALIELPKALDRAEPGELPLTRRLQDAFERRLAPLPPQSRTLLLLAAAGTGELTPLLAAARELGVSLQAVEPAEDCGLIEVKDGRLAFRHPLMRAAAYHSAPPSARLTAHLALAAAFSEPKDADRRAWHLAAAATGEDEALAEELERTAVRAAGRNGYAAAAAAYRRAAELSAVRGERTRRLTLAAESMEYGGLFDQARAIAEQAGGPDVEPELTSRLIRVRACSDYGQGLLPSAHAQLSLGAAHITEDDPREAAWLLLDACSLIWLDGDRDMAARTAAQLIDLRLPPGDPVLPVYRLSLWFVSLALRRPVEGLPPLPEVVPAARELGGIDRRGLLLTAALGLAEPDGRAHDLATAVLARIREENMVGLLPQALVHLASIQLAVGWYADARAHANEAARIAADTAQPQWVKQANLLLAHLAAIEGDTDGCEGFPEARALLNLGLGGTEAALLELENLVYGRARNQIFAMRSVPDLVEAAVRCGRRPRATEPFARFAEWADLLDQRWAHALVSRCRALLEPAEEHFTAAIELHGHDRPFERARTELLYGEWLRRARRRTDARPHLALAVEIFDRLGSAPWSARARAELDAAGWATSRTEGFDPLAVLTPQERQITQLAAQGLSNRDIAARLFLSPRTVGQHLYKAFPKLGVTSRTELSALSM
ncbi:AAA family ATPase [Sphaerisporangium perillae]|uniref:AAA family ATPase n=1 Tax=Sphaerisporangium perillae TaxID=2935860 RepID=UPI00200D2A78|nr:LuxR family transcriptional regulator [Sphaerisporangium perillae]